MKAVWMDHSSLFLSQYGGALRPAGVRPGPLCAGVGMAFTILRRAAKNVAKLVAKKFLRCDLDGRVNLTTAGLAEWINFFLDICADQVGFMTRMLELDGMKRRMEALITFRAMQDKDIRPEAILPLHHVFAAGPVTRREFIQMIGLGDRTARSLMRACCAQACSKAARMPVPCASACHWTRCSSCSRNSIRKRRPNSSDVAWSFQTKCSSAHGAPYSAQRIEIRYAVSAGQA
jgi:hypothetical protein